MATVEDLIRPTIEYLVQQAEEGNLRTYSEVAAAVGTHHRVIPKVLWQIAELCVDNGWAALTALVVNKASRKPGAAFLDFCFPGASKEEQIIKWQGMVDEVHAFDWFGAFSQT